MSRSFSFSYRCFRILLDNGAFSLRNSSSIIGFSPIRLSLNARLFSKSPNQGRPLVISYLIDSCGLSAESAKSVSKSIDFENPNRPDSVLRFLKEDYGFTDSEISRIVKRTPLILVSDPAKTLLPKLKFLSSIVGSGSQLRDIVCYNPYLLSWSLNDKLVPNYNLLKSVLGDERKVVRSLRNCVFGGNLHKYGPTNIALLRKIGVSKKQISALLTFSPDVLSCSDAVGFKRNVDRVIEMGFHPYHGTFVYALNVISTVPEKAMERKIEAYKTWGLSEKEILLAFKKYPCFLSKTVKKVTETMDFFVNKIKMNYHPADVICFPEIFGYSLENRIIPRFSVIKVLQVKGFVDANISISTVMRSTKKQFLENYVVKHEADVPQLFSIYRGKKSVQELVSEIQEEKQDGG